MRRSAKTLLVYSRTLASQVWLVASVRALLVAFFVAVAVYYLLDRAQSFTIFAPTQSVTVDMAGSDPQYWSLMGATLCRRIPPDGTLPDKADPPDERCNAALYTRHSLDFVDIVWPPGTRLAIMGNDARSLAIQVGTSNASVTPEFGATTITDRSVVLFDRATLSDMGGLVAFGAVRIGELAEAGAVNLVRGGRYEIREDLALTPGTSVVASGDIMPGDYLRLTDREGKSLLATLFMTQSGTALADFDVVLTSPAQKSALEVSRIGNARTAITTRWTDRLSNDPLPLAVSILLGLLGASLGIAKSLAGGGRGGK